MTNDRLWQAKLHARLHDPAEKALVLLRDPAGHEGGTSRELHRLLFKEDVPPDIRRLVKRADWWASAADRPQWPEEEERLPTGKVVRRPAAWARVNWAKEPTLIHPLNGTEVNLGTDFGVDVNRLAATDVENIKARSLEHFRSLMCQVGGATDWRRTLLAYWRFGPEIREEDGTGKLGELWRLLPADTRVPDHAIWDHLDLVSAFAGGFAADANNQAALLTVSLGPVQSFITSARTTSDLWAGSHLLAQLAWTAMKVVCERLGPDAILLPRLRDIPQVDVWLRDECGLPAQWFDDCSWTKRETDANPLFSAALPNRFVAVVPADSVADIAVCIEESVRAWLQELGTEVVHRLLDSAGLRKADELHDCPAYQQMREQLNGFPEVHWAAVPFSLIRPRDERRQTDLDTSRLSEAMAPFFGVEGREESGFLVSRAWQVLKKTPELNGVTFFAPNPGVLYPAVYDLAERALAAAKSVRPFQQTEQLGWRCSLTGETESLTTDRRQLVGSYRQQNDTLWKKVAARHPTWAKQGEHLGGLPAVKRVWPTLFAKRVAGITNAKQVSRFVVSTHTMALAKQIENRAKSSAKEARLQLPSLKGATGVALPRGLARHGHAVLGWARRLPGSLEDAAEKEDENEQRRAEQVVKEILGVDKIEAYYGLLLMDGDHMGQILSGDAPCCSVSYRQSFHPSVRKGFAKLADGNRLLEDYAKERRASSPNRHISISAALNDFAIHVVPEVIENEHLGRVLYAGGDDVMAMLPVADLLPAMRRLRETYSGDASEHSSVDWTAARHSNRLICKHGFAYLKGRLMRMMGGATASCGAVVAHHKAPLAAVMGELRSAEKRAKEAGRDAFSLTLIKRSGGSLHMTERWGQPMSVLLRLRDLLTEPGVSRRAVYNSLVWLKDLPDEADHEMLASLLAFQFRRQAQPSALREHAIDDLASELAELANKKMPTKRRQWLERFLSIAEFLARETRTSSEPRTSVSAQVG